MRRLPGGGHALETSIDDLTTGKSGFMIASAKNGFMQTSFADCSGTPFNYQPEYSTAKKANIIPWAALETNISTQFEIGHFEPCTSVQNPMPITLGTFHDTIWQDCTSPYESTTMPDGGSNPEISDAPCWPKGFTHGGRRAAQQGGGVHPDHRPERRPGLRRHVVLGRLAEPDDAEQLAVAVPPDAAVDPRPRIPADPVPDERAGERGRAAMPTGVGCAVPPPGGPGKFYPWWTQAKVNGECVWEFGQMRNGNTFGRTQPVRRPVGVLLREPGGPDSATNQNC